ncbi:MAG: LacI family DNA-binding transcriptional regulator [Chthoniobacteraceae bacterium]
MSHIAEQLGLTRQTVSAIINNRYKALRISEETAQRVRDEAARFGYLRNHLALAIRTGQNNVIGCLLSGLADERVSLTLSGLLAEASSLGYLVKIEEVEGDEAGRIGLNRLIEQRVAALFCCNFHPSAELVDVFAQTVQRYNVAAVACASNPSLLAHHIASDDLAGCELAVGHLWKLGHRRIAFVGAAINKLRMDGFVAAMQRRHVNPPPAFVADVDWDCKKAAEETNRLLSLGKERPTAIFCANDKLAAAVIREVRNHGLRVPKDLSVVGFSGSTLCESLDPRLISVSQPFLEMGHRCAQRLTKALGKAKAVPLKPTSEIVPVTLLKGESTAVAPKK